MQIKGLASAATPTENSSYQNLVLEERPTTVFDDDQENSTDRHMPEDIRVGQNKNKRSIKRSIKANDHNLYTSQTNTSASPLQVSEAKRSKQNKVNKNITPANGNIAPNSSDLILNNNKSSLLDSTEASNVISNAELETGHPSPVDFHGTTASLWRVKEESSGIDHDLTNPHDGRSTNSRNSYIHQSEHVVIPTDPSLMQGIFLVNFKKRIQHLWKLSSNDNIKLTIIFYTFCIF